MPASSVVIAARRSPGLSSHAKGCPDITRDLKVFACPDSEGLHGRALRADLGVELGVGVPCWVDGDAKKPEALRGAGADRPAVFTDAAGEDERVDAAHRGGHGGDAGAQAVQVDPDSELGIRVA